MSTEVHAFLFNNEKFTTNKARDWLKRNRYKQRNRVMKIGNYLRYNITPKKNNVLYRTINFGDNILAILEIQKGGKSNTKIQAIIFQKEDFTTKKARDWLKKYGYKPIKKVDKTKNYLRYRLTEPKKNSMYRIIDFGDDIKAVLEIINPKKKYIN